MVESIREPLLFSRLASCKSILFAGAGGGFDVYSALPLAAALRTPDRRVHLANLSFSWLGDVKGAEIAPGLFEVRPTTRGSEPYFPERALARFLRTEGWDPVVYAMPRSGVRQLQASYEHLVEKLAVDAVVLVDGGTDLLMLGDEAGLGSPVEDMTSLAAVGNLRVRERHLACIGFGIDAFHGVCHAHFLENVAALEADGAYHGAFSVPRRTSEGDLFLRAVRHASDEHPEAESIVQGSIAAAMRGEFGDVQFTGRTSGSELFINPLMPVYFTFDLMGVCKRNLYVRELVGSPSVFHTASIIESFRDEVKTRPRRDIPG